MSTLLPSTWSRALVKSGPHSLTISAPHNRGGISTLEHYTNPIMEGTRKPPLHPKAYNIIYRNSTIQVSKSTNTIDYMGYKSCWVRIQRRSVRIMASPRRGDPVAMEDWIRGHLLEHFTTAISIPCALAQQGAHAFVRRRALGSLREHSRAGESCRLT